MAIRTLLDRLYARLRAFHAAEGGNVILTFALATIPIIGFVGAAVDYSRGNSAKAAMQSAIDSTALMLSKDAQTLTTAQLAEKGAAYFMALLNRPEVTNINLTPALSSPSDGSFKLDVTATGLIDTTFIRVLGQQTIDLEVNSEVRWGVKKLELALALDNTGSMASANKMTELKNAAKSLLDTLKKAAKKDGDVKVAIIPFDTTVRIGTSYKNEPWFDVSCSALGSPPGCNVNNWKNYWEGCVRDRTYPYDTQDNSPVAGTPDTLYPIYDCGSLTQMQPLTTDWTKLNSKIDAMTPNGMTNVTMGLVWAWHALTPNTPLTEAAASAPDLDKVIIVLTDGTNTESWKNSNNTKVTNASAIDQRTALACTNIKAANVKIYAIRVIDGNATLLKNCANSPSMYFDVQNASQLNTVFGTIAQNLANLRIAK